MLGQLLQTAHRRLPLADQRQVGQSLQVEESPLTNNSAPTQGCCEEIAERVDSIALPSVALGLAHAVFGLVEQLVQALVRVSDDGRLAAQTSFIVVACESESGPEFCFEHRLIEGVDAT